MRETSLPFFSAPLVAALKNIDGWLGQENAARIIAATNRMKEISRSSLPDHVKIVSRPLKGRRVVTRNSRYFKQTRTLIAHYPESQMEVRAIPALLCVIRGAAHIHAGNYVLHCQPGDFVLIPPMIPKGNFSHAIEENSCDVLYLYPGQLLGEGLECWIAHSHGEKIDTGARLGTAVFRDVFVAAMFDQLCDEIKRSPRNEITYFLLRSLVLLLLRELREGRASEAYPRDRRLPAEPMHDPIKHALAHISSHLDEPLTIASMARETALSATNFKLLFRRITGQSFHQYLTDARLEFAKKLLKETGLKVPDVAERVGLSSSRFIHLFRERFSCSPGEYRKQK